MDSRTDLSAGLVAAFAMGCAPPVLAEAIVEAQNWNDAISFGYTRGCWSAVFSHSMSKNYGTRR